MTVGLILVSHSGPVAQGTADLARQMAPSVTVAAAGGTEDGAIGTSFDLITRGHRGGGLGRRVRSCSTTWARPCLTTETALEFCDPEQAERIRVVDAPLVEGAIAAAVAAEGGGDLAAVVAAAQSAGAQFAPWLAEVRRSERRRRPRPTVGRRRRRWSPCAIRLVCTPVRPRSWCARSRAGTPRSDRPPGRPGGRPALGARRGRTDHAWWRSGPDPGRRGRRRCGAGRSGAAHRGRLRGAGRHAAARPVDGVAVRGGPGDRRRTVSCTPPPGQTGAPSAPSARLADLPDTLPAVAGADPASRDRDCPRPSPPRRTGWPPVASSPRRTPRWWPTPNCAERPTSTSRTAPRPPGGPRSPRPPPRSLLRRTSWSPPAPSTCARPASRCWPTWASASIGCRRTYAGKSCWQTISGRPRCRCCWIAGAVAAVLAGGSTTAHAVIVARGLRSADGAAGRQTCWQIWPRAAEVVVDGAAGTVQLDPDDADGAGRVRGEITEEASAAEALRARRLHRWCSRRAPDHGGGQRRVRRRCAQGGGVRSRRGRPAAHRTAGVGQAGLPGRGAATGRPGRDLRDPRRPPGRRPGARRRRRQAGGHPGCRREAQRFPRSARAALPAGPSRPAAHPAPGDHAGRGGAPDLGDGTDGHRGRGGPSRSRMRSPRRSTRWPPTGWTSRPRRRSG